MLLDSTRCAKKRHPKYQIARDHICFRAETVAPPSLAKKSCTGGIASPVFFFSHFCRQPAKHWGKISDSGKISGTWLPDDKHALQIQCRPLVDSLMRPGLMRSHNSAPSGTLSDWPTYAGLDNIPSRATWPLQSTYIALIK